MKNFQFYKFNRLTQLITFFGGLFLFIPSVVSALTISPPIFDLKALPGEIIIASLVLENETNSSLTLRGSVEAFAPNAKGNEAEFYPSNEGLPTWVKLSEQEVSLAPGENKKIVLKIFVPGGTAGGSYYAAVFWAIAPPSDVTTGAAVASKLGALVFLRVEGVVRENLELPNFVTAKKINTSLPVIFEAKVKNTGNVYLAPKGEIVIKNWIGKEVAVLPWNEVGSRVLPGIERTIEAKWGEHKILEEIKYGLWGFYTASIHISYGLEIKETGDVVSFWILPIKSLGIFLSAIILAILIIRFVVARYNQWIIKKHLGR